MLDGIGKNNLDLSALATSKMALGVSCDQCEEFEKANVYYTECIQLIEEIGTNRDTSDKGQMALAYMNRANNNYSMGSINKALPDYDKAINILLDLQENNELQDSFDLFMAYKNRSQAYEAKVDMASAADDIILALRVLKRIFSDRRELQVHYFEVLGELIELLDFKGDAAKKQSVLDEFLHSMRHKFMDREAVIARDNILKSLQ